MSFVIKNVNYLCSVWKKEDFPDLRSIISNNNLPIIGVIGRSNSGKSSFINTILERKNLAYTSSSPGKTRSLNFYNVDDKFVFVDFPGYGYKGVASPLSKDWNELANHFFYQYEGRKYIIFLIDCRRKVDQLDLQLLDFLKLQMVPILYILTKIDKVPKTKISGVKSQFVETFSCDKSCVIPYSSLTKQGKEDVISYLKKII
jgi:GTP-binding protein